MQIKVLNIFYGADGLPYKDVERTVHYPITSGTFLGSSNTTEIRFYYDLLDGLNESTFVAVSKLPNGKIGSEILENKRDSELEENYAVLNLSSFYTQYKGDVYIALQGYQGGVRVEEDENGIYSIVGTPTIKATGSIRLSIAYAPMFVGSGQTENITLQRVLAELATKLGVRQETLYVEELPSIGNPNIWYVVNNDENDPTKANIYVWNAITQNYVWVGDNTLNLGDYYSKEEGEQFENSLNGDVSSFKNDVNLRVTSVENELESVASGSPAGVYTDVEALEIADPDHSRIYLIQETGEWYYWDGTSWTDGGTYLSSLPDDEINEDSTNALQNKIIAKYLKIQTLQSLIGERDTFEASGGVLAYPKNGTKGWVTSSYDTSSNYLKVVRQKDHSYLAIIKLSTELTGATLYAGLWDSATTLGTNNRKSLSLLNGSFYGEIITPSTDNIAAYPCFQTTGSSLGEYDLDMTIIDVTAFLIIHPELIKDTTLNTAKEILNYVGAVAMEQIIAAGQYVYNRYIPSSIVAVETDEKKISKQTYESDVADTYKENLGYLSPANGTVVEYSSAFVSDYIEVVADTIVSYENIMSIGQTNAIVCWYDAQKNFIGSQTASGSGGVWTSQTGSLVLPSNAKYIRYNMRLVNTGNPEQIIRYFVSEKVFGSITLDREVKYVDEQLFYKNVDKMISEEDTDIDKTDLAYFDTSGNVVSYSSAFVSDFIECIGGTEIEYNIYGITNVSSYLCIYNENKQLIANRVSAGSTPASWELNSGSFTLPANAKYIRYNMKLVPIVDSTQYLIMKVKRSVKEQVEVLSSSGIGGVQWQGKKWYAFGTSITDTSSISTETGQPTGKYVPYLVAMSGMNVVNNGIAGGTIGKNGSYGGTGNILSRILATDVSDADLITIEGFVNDFACGIAFGTPQSIDDETMYGALYKAIKYCQENSNAVIVLLTDSTGKPGQTSGGVNVDYTFNTRWVAQADGHHAYQDEYNEIIRKVAKEMGCICIDAGAKSAINCFHPQFLMDWIHHSYLGGKQYAQTIWNELKNISLLKKDE